MKKNVFVLREFPLQIASLSNGERDFIPKLRHCVDGGNFYPLSRMHVFQSLSDTFPSDVFCTKKKSLGQTCRLWDYQSSWLRRHAKIRKCWNDNSAQKNPLHQGILRHNRQQAKYTYVKSICRTMCISMTVSIGLKKFMSVHHQASNLIQPAYGSCTHWGRSGQSRRSALHHLPALPAESAPAAKSHPLKRPKEEKKTEIDGL